jgi:hypothetical protein
MKKLLFSLILMLIFAYDISGQYAESWTDYANGMPMPPGQETGNSRNINNGRSATYYTDRTAFQAANPGLPLEDFESSPVLPGDLEYCDEPINDVSNNCFIAGDLIPGFSLSTFEGIRAGCSVDECPMVILGAGLIGGNTDIVVGPNYLNDTYLITFDPPVSAAGMDFFSTGETFDIVITDGNGMTTMTTAAASLTGTFWGVECPEMVASIQLISSIGVSELIDNLEFGVNAPPIPTIGEWGIICLSILLMIGGLLAFRTRDKYAF